MDIERLMRDLHVNDLQRIYSELTVDLEEKKEELRQMVGRRYRDVLDASSSVRKVTESADAFANKLREIRGAVSDRSFTSLSWLARQQYIQLSALNKLYFLIGTMDPLSDVFVLLLVESIHRTLSAEVVRSTQGSALVKLLSPKLIRLRLSLEDEFVASLGDLSTPGETVNQLVAIGVLKKLSIPDLLKLFLDSKTSSIRKDLAESRSLIKIVWNIRRSFECIQRLFIDGQLGAVLRFFYTFHWIPKAVDQCISDEPLSFSNCLQTEISHLAENKVPHSLDSLDQETFKEQCSTFLETICVASREMVEQKCSLFESTSSVLDFLTVLLEAFEKDWPVIGSGDIVYQKFFQNLIRDRFKVLVSSELDDIIKSFLSKVPSVNCHPPSLFKKRSTRFEPLLACGVSEQLVGLVEQFDSDLRCLHAKVQKYEALGKESDLQQLHEQLADSVVEVLSKCRLIYFVSFFFYKFSRALENTTIYLCLYCSVAHLCEIKVEENVHSTGSKEEHSLIMTRVYLALLRPRNSVISLCLSGNNEKIGKCANLLRTTAEKHFCDFLDALVGECLESSNIKSIGEICFDPFAFISYIQEYEKVELPEVGVVEVPLQVTSVLYGFLYSLCAKISIHSLSHMFTRRIRMYLNEKLGIILGGVYGEVLKQNKPLISRIAVQYLFDVRLLNCLFSTDPVRHLIGQFEALVDPFDLSLISNLLARNARIAAQRYSVLFAPHFGDSFTSKEPSLSASYTAVVDIVPRVTDVPRFTLISRLSKASRNPGEPLRTVASAVNISSRKKTGRQGESVRTTPSLSSLYNWFGK
ncbi:unnamed protein product [Enterobius vermicularis]|uniref:Conserved oligomeric Golgi complex subunit 1 n=1 Tax=Enterobius vermicularis TaxID=51028 RepID=A0A158QBB8_ENTVE|nr:unnamed protein product [Enterobius vermicularis]